MYQVVFKGKIAEGKDVEQVKKNLAVLHKVSLEKIEPLFSGDSIVVKKGAERNIAEAVKIAYERAGAICMIEPTEKFSIPLDIPQITCPKCRFEQPQAAVCSNCGLIFNKYQPISPEKQQEKNISNKKHKLLAQVIGKPGKVSLGTVVPAFWGATKLELYSNRVVEQTTRIVSSNNSEILLSEIDSVVISRKGDPVWLAIGILTLPIYGLGVLFLILYFLLTHRFLTIFSGNNSVTVSIIGEETPYREFKDALLFAAEEAKYGTIST